jgi:formylglycine-generating enzyme required for sulfatase activity
VTPELIRSFTRLPTPIVPRPAAWQVYTNWPFDAEEAKERQRDTARALGVEDAQEIDLGKGVKVALVLIPAGQFTMGSPPTEAQRNDDETQRQVTISRPFWMGKHEVTQEQWEALGLKNASNLKGANNPVECVSWHDVQDFLQKLNARAGGRRFALPTEAQWEYACRAGTATPFHFGETISTDQANYDGNYTYGNGQKGEYRRETTVVGIFPPNAWGLRDMHGNVWEWCQDWFGAYKEGAQTDPTGSEKRDYRVVRGGSWYSDPRLLRSASRSGILPVDRYHSVGFRLVLAPGP